MIISTKYPKAFEEFKKWLVKEDYFDFYKGKLIRDELNYEIGRFLVDEREIKTLMIDFFDSLGIYGQVKLNVFFMWYWEIIVTPEYGLDKQFSKSDFSTREQGERDLHPALFEMLESYLIAKAKIHIADAE